MCISYDWRDDWENRKLSVDQDVYINQRVAKIDPHKEVSKEFVYYAISTNDFQLFIQNNIDSHSAQENISATSIGRFPIQIPPLPEQKVVAGVLGALDDKIELNRRMNETLEAMAQAIFKDWFVDFGPTRAKMEGLTPYLAPALWSLFPDSLNADGIPQGWEYAPLNQVVEVNPREILKKGTCAPYIEMKALPVSRSRSDAPVIRAFSSGSKFRKEDVLLARITPCLENGKTAFVDTLEDNVIGWGSTEFIVLRAKLPLPPAYAYTLARSDSFRTYAISNMTGTSGRQRVQPDVIAQYEVAIPTIAIAKTFGSLIKPLFTSIQKNAEESGILEEIRDLLLPRLMSGKLRVRGL